LPTVNLSATLKDVNGNPLQGKPIKFYYSYNGTDYTLITTVNTNASGVAETTHTTDATTWYKAVFEGDEQCYPSEDVVVYSPISGWLDEWQYRKTHVIEGSSAGAVTDYQIRIVVHYGSGTDSGEDVYLNEKCRSDFGDIRFTSDDGETELSYWIEEKVDGDYAIFWVKVPSIPASPDEATICIYYGKSDAVTTSDIKDTFVVGDDFDDGTIDSMWTQSGSMTEEDGYLKLTGADAYVETSFSGLSNLRWKARVRQYQRDSEEGWEVSFFSSSYEDYFDLYDYRDRLRMSRRGVGVQAFKNIKPDTNWHIVEAYFLGVNFKLWYDGTLELDDSKPSTETYTKVRLKNDVVSGGVVWFDWFFLRKYVDPEPSHGSWGSEEVYTPTKNVVVSNESVTPSSGFAGDSVTYSAVVKDEDGDPLPEDFVADLLMNSTVIIDNQHFVAGVYDSGTGELTLVFTVPSLPSGTKTVKLKWEEQTI